MSGTHIISIWCDGVSTSSTVHYKNSRTEGRRVFHPSPIQGWTWPSSLADGAFEVYGARGGTPNGQHHRGFDENTEGKEVGQMRQSTPLHLGGVVERRWRSVGGRWEE